jgi:hypothetical protein
MDMTTMYKVKGIGKETTITSKVNIFHEGGKITKVEDKWDGKLPDSGIANVSKPWTNAVDPRFWANYWLGWSYSLLVFVHDRWWWMVRSFVILLHPEFSIASSYLSIALEHTRSYVELQANKTLLIQAFRRLNAVSVPKMVGVPNNAEEDAKRGN